MDNSKSIDIAVRVLEEEAQAILELKNNLDKNFEQIVEKIVNTKGKIIITGMGKSGHIAGKIAATMASLGKPAFFIHPGEAMHGDLGMVQPEDTVVMISVSGESEEIVKIIPNLKIIGADIIGITANSNSKLARASEFVQLIGECKEACNLGLAPTTSTTLTLAIGDAICVAVSSAIGFRKNDFALFHPAGSLGKSLTLRVSDLMETIAQENIVKANESIETALSAIIRLQTSVLPIVDENNILQGIITAEQLTDSATLDKIGEKKPVLEIMNDTIDFVNFDEMAIDALSHMENSGIDALPVVKDEKTIGVITKKEILKAGIYVQGEKHE